MTKKQLLSLLLAIALLVPPAAAGEEDVAPVVSKQDIVLISHGEQTVHTIPMYYISGTNYIKLRDFAVLLDGTEKQFDCTWRASAASILLDSGRPYVPNGTEGQPLRESPTVRPSDSNVLLDSSPIALAGYKLNGSNFYKLRDVGRAVDAAVYWDYVNRQVMVSASHPAAAAAGLEAGTKQAARTGHTPSPNPWDTSLFHMKDGRMVYDGEPAPRLGIDVSSYQHAIDWKAVAADGVKYAILRLGYRGYTEGTTALDERFYDNFAGARDNGLDIGVYFYSQAITEEEAVEEAEIVIRALEGLKVTYPVFFDWERVDGKRARTNRIGEKELTEITLAFCRRIEEAGYIAGVYFNRDLATNVYDMAALEDYVLWLARYNDFPDYSYAFTLWQYSCTGKVAGISTNVDMDLSFWRPEKSNA